MPGPEFPHLRLLTIQEGRARLRGGGAENDRVKANVQNRAAHGRRLLASLSRVTLRAKQVAEDRERLGLPAIPGGTSFLLEIPDGDMELLDFLTHNLGLELVAEFPEGFVLVANQDLDQMKLVELARAFIQDRRGGARAASILEIYDPQNSDLRVKKILDEELQDSWPFPEKAVLTFDVSIQTAGNFAEYEENEPVKRTKESDNEFARRHRDWSEALHELRVKWARQQQERRNELLGVSNALRTCLDRA